MLHATSQRKVQIEVVRSLLGFGFSGLYCEGSYWPLLDTYLNLSTVTNLGFMSGGRQLDWNPNIWPTLSIL